MDPSSLYTCSLLDSWENGTKSEAILEYSYPSYSIFTFPLPSLSSVSNSIPQPIIDIATTTLSNRPTYGSNATTVGASLLSDGAASDPASLGMAVVMANASAGEGQNEVKGVTFGMAAEEEVLYLLKTVPRVSS